MTQRIAHSLRGLLSAALTVATLTWVTASTHAQAQQPPAAPAQSAAKQESAPAAPAPATTQRPQTSKTELVSLLKTIDERQRNQGDWRSDVYIEQKEKGKVAVVYNAIVYRRSADQRFIILFTAPKNVVGQGYLRVDKNLWFYDPAVGKWERRTERERIGGTNSRRSDFDESRLAEEYDPSDAGEEKLGAYNAQRVDLKGKSGLDLAFPVIKLWVDKDTHNVLKRQEFALSGRLLRTSYYPKWKKVFSESKKQDVWFPQEIRFYDEVEKENSTLVLIKAVDLHSLEQNLFTKAWLESKSR
ncbi:MAG TPA: outer membrane lipoprotein-sorting protein [Polyangiales bacterium]|nr:outer membrane lipoprotein-sorting protein [Polyangiales bacterium]